MADLPYNTSVKPTSGTKKQTAGAGSGLGRIQKAAIQAKSSKGK